MIYVFLGSEISVLKKKIDETISSLKINNIINYDFSDSSMIDIINEVNYVDLFNEKKLIIVNNFLFKKLKEKDENILIKYIDNMNDNVIIFKCVDEKLDERKKVIKSLREKCKVIVCEKLDYKSLHAYVQNVFKENKKEITFNQIKKILDLCEYDTDKTMSEVEKLLLYKMDSKSISDSDIDDVVVRSTDKELYSFNECVLNRKIGEAFDSLKILLNNNIDSIIIIDSLARQYRLLYQMKVLHEEMSYDDMARSLGINSFVIKKMIPFVNMYDEEEIIDKLMKLSDMDYDIKANGYDKDKVLEMFLIAL